MNTASLIEKYLVLTNFQNDHGILNSFFQFSEALVSSRTLFEQLAGAGKEDNKTKSVLELGFDESRFFDKAGRMGLAVTRHGLPLFTPDDVIVT